jgi:uncharacterized protein YhbP (UPF0306 family)
MRNPLEEAAHLLDTVWTMVLAVELEGGGAHSAPVYFVRGDGFSLYWLSSPGALHSREIERAGAAAASVFQPSRRWTQLRGVQLRGEAAAVRKNRAIIEKYQAKFRLGGELKPIISRSRLYRLEPRWMRLIDNRRGFGWNMEWEFPASLQK